MANTNFGGTSTEHLVRISNTCFPCLYAGLPLFVKLQPKMEENLYDEVRGSSGLCVLLHYVRVQAYSFNQIYRTFLFLKFGNYVGPELEEDEDEEDSEEEDEDEWDDGMGEDEDGGAAQDPDMTTLDPDTEMQYALATVDGNSNAVVLHEDKNYYPSAEEGEARIRLESFIRMQTRRNERTQIHHIHAQKSTIQYTAMQKSWSKMKTRNLSKLQSLRL